VVDDTITSLSVNLFYIVLNARRELMSSEKLRLVNPSTIYEKEFIKNIYDYEENNEIEYYDTYKEALTDFGKYVDKLLANAKGENLPKGWTIAVTTLWLTNEEESRKVFGCIRLRHKNANIHGHIGYDVPPRYRHNGYGKKLLELSLPYAKKIGLNSIYLTCRVDNIPSESVIRSCGGKLYDIITDPNGKVFKQYVIELGTDAETV